MRHAKAIRKRASIRVHRTYCDQWSQAQKARPIGDVIDNAHYLWWYAKRAAR
jgi:hypothetical protein